MQQVGTNDSCEPDNLCADGYHEEVPNEFLEVCGRQSEFVDAALLGHKVVEHIARGYYAIGTAYEWNQSSIKFRIVFNFSWNIEIARKNGIKVNQDDWETTQGYHKKWGAEIESAVDGKVPTSNIYKAVEIKLFHDFG